MFGSCTARSPSRELFLKNGSEQLCKASCTVGAWQCTQAGELDMFSIFLGVYALVVLSVNYEINERQDLEQRARAFSACPQRGKLCAQYHGLTSLVRVL